MYFPYNILPILSKLSYLIIIHDRYISFVRNVSVLKKILYEING